MDKGDTIALLGLVEGKINNYSKKLNTNFISQVVLIFVGISIFTYSDIYLKTILQGFLKIEESQDHFLILIPILLNYYFIRFGYLLFNYLSARRLYDNLIGSLSEGEDTRTSNLLAINSKTDSLFESIYSPRLGQIKYQLVRNVLYVLYVLFIAIIFILNHSVTFFMFDNFIDNIFWKCGIRVLFILFLLPFYFAFRSLEKDDTDENSQAERKPTKDCVTIIIILSVPLTIYLFYTQCFLPILEW